MRVRPVNVDPFKVSSLDVNPLTGPLLGPGRSSTLVMLPTNRTHPWARASRIHRHLGKAIRQILAPAVGIPAI
jgi:hypothetical protein